MNRILQPISYPQKGAAGNTGEWRITKPIIDKGKCIYCKTCWVYCPEAVINKDTIEIDEQYCKGCGICANQCPVGAISMEKEGLNG